MAFTSEELRFAGVGGYSKLAALINETNLEQPNRFIVTVKMPKNKKHDPRNKITGSCPLSRFCTDVTGEHHSKIEEGFSAAELQKMYEDAGYHVTRIEQVS